VATPSRLGTTRLPSAPNDRPEEWGWARVAWRIEYDLLMTAESNSGAGPVPVAEAEVRTPESPTGIPVKTWAGSRRKPGVIATVLATVFGNLYMILGTIFFATLALLVGWLPPRGNAVYGVARWWSRLLLFFSGVRVESRFESELDPNRQFIYMANHQSLFDIPVLIATLPGQTRFLAKRSLFQIPLFGWAIKLGGFVTIDREDGRRAQNAFAVAAKRLAAGVSILIFPEATRSEDGKLLPFKRGGMLLALKSGLPIVPVGVCGSLDVQPRSRYSIRPMPIRVRYGSPIEVTEYGVRQRKVLEELVRERIAELAEIEA